MRPQAYYAHCQAIYGTRQERRDHDLIRDLGYEPILFDEAAVQNEVANVKAAGGDVMGQVFEPLVESCEILFFRALPDGRIPAGVYREIGCAVMAGIPVLELPSGMTSRQMTVEATREYLHEVGQR